MAEPTTNVKTIALQALRRIPALGDLRVAYSWHGDDVAQQKLDTDTTAGLWLTDSRTEYRYPNMRAGTRQRETEGRFVIVLELLKAGKLTTDGSLVTDLQYAADVQADGIVSAIDQWIASNPRLGSDLIYFAEIESVERTGGPTNTGVGAMREITVRYQSRQL